MRKERSWSFKRKLHVVNVQIPYTENDWRTRGLSKQRRSFLACAGTTVRREFKFLERHDIFFRIFSCAECFSTHNRSKGFANLTNQSRLMSAEPTNQGAAIEVSFLLRYASMKLARKNKRS